MEPRRTQRGQAAERFLTTENTEQHGKEIRMHFRFCVLPCFPFAAHNAVFLAGASPAAGLGCLPA